MTQPLTLDDTRVPSGFWRIDPAASSVWFAARHLVVSKVWGQFRRFAGTLEIADDPERSSVRAAIEAASLSTGDPTRDLYVLSAEVLDVGRFPLLRFASTALEHRGGNSYVLHGDLTVKDVTRPVELEMRVRSVPESARGVRVAFSASTDISRRDFGIVWNSLIEAGGAVVGDRIHIELEIEAVRS